MHTLESLRLRSIVRTGPLLGLGLTSCLPLEAGPCSDLEIGEELAVTIQAPVGNDPCDLRLGLVSGATIRLSVEEEGDTHTCTSMMGLTAIPGIDLTYDPEQSFHASGTDPFVSTSDVAIGSCQGLLVVLLKTSDIAEDDTFSRMRVRYYGGLDSECPRSCDLDYSIDVTRM